MRLVATVVALGLLVAACSGVERATTALTTSPTAAVGASSPGPSPTAAGVPSIAIETPFANGEVSNPVSITGRADVVGASLTVRVLGGNGDELAATVVRASCGEGCSGTFATELFFFVDRRQPGTIEVSGISEQGGPTVATVPVVLVPA